jgi:hypothetical protein
MVAYRDSVHQGCKARLGGQEGLAAAVLLAFFVVTLMIVMARRSFIRARVAGHAPTGCVCQRPCVGNGTVAGPEKPEEDRNERQGFLDTHLSVAQ